MTERDRMYRPGDAAKELRNSRQGEGRLPTGYSIDNLGMVAPGELALIWARSGSGKSTWVLNVIANTPQVPTVVFNMEMLCKAQSEWLAAMTLNLPVHANQIGQVIADLDHPDSDAVYDAIANQLNVALPYVGMYQPYRPTLVELDDIVKSAADDWGRPVKRVFIDHLELLNETEDYQQVKKTTDDLHKWAQNNSFGLYVVQQTTRGGNNYKNDGHLPVTLSSGVYSGEQAADFIYGLYRPVRDPAVRDDIAKRERLKYITRLQLIKNRPFAETNDEGIELEYVPYTRKLVELTEENL